MPSSGLKKYALAATLGIRYRPATGSVASRSLAGFRILNRQTLQQKKLSAKRFSAVFADFQ